MSGIRESKHVGEKERNLHFNVLNEKANMRGNIEIVDIDHIC